MCLFYFIRISFFLPTNHGHWQATTSTKKPKRQFTVVWVSLHHNHDQKRYLTCHCQDQPLPMSPCHHHDQHQHHHDAASNQMKTAPEKEENGRGKVTSTMAGARDADMSRAVVCFLFLYFLTHTNNYLRIDQKIRALEVRTSPIG